MASDETLAAVAAVVQRNRERLAAVRPMYETRLERLARQAQAELREQLVDLDPTRFQAQAARTVLRQVEGVIDDPRLYRLVASING